MLERFANEQWLPVHVTRDEAAAIVLDQFKRTVAQTVELLAVKAHRAGAPAYAGSITRRTMDHGFRNRRPALDD